MQIPNKVNSFLNKINPFKRGLLISIIPGILIMFIYGIANISFLESLSLLITIGCVFYGTYHYFKKTSKKGLDKFLFIFIAFFSYLSISIILLFFIVLAFQPLWDDHFKTEFTKITTDPVRYNKQELLDFKERSSSLLLSTENRTLIDNEILKINQIETDKKLAEAKKVEEQQLAEAKKVEELQKQQEEKEKVANQKQKEELASCKIAYLYTQMVVYGLEKRLLDFSESECDRYNQVMDGIVKDGKTKFDEGMANEILNKTELGCLGAYSYSKMAALKSKDPSDEIHAQLVFKFSRCDTYFSYFN